MRRRGVRAAMTRAPDQQAAFAFAEPSAPAPAPAATTGAPQGDPNILRQFLDLRPAGGFDLIMADPPWLYRNWSEAGTDKNAVAHYDCTPLDWIAGLPVSALAADDCLLWLWATNPMLRDALAVIDAWGFTYKTAGTWVKRTVHGKVAFGTGYIVRSANEPIILATRGSPKVTRGTRSAIVSSDAPDDIAADWPIGTVTVEGPVREHSQKPDEAFAACEALMPEARRIEVFSRTTRPGWSAWGNEVGKLGVAT